jgi:hypothetical protein
MADKYDTEPQAVPVMEAAPPAKLEGDAERSVRRKVDLDALFAAHMNAVRLAHKLFPTPAIPFARMKKSDKIKAREKQKLIIVANKKYHVAVRETCRRHRDEESVRLRKIAQAKKEAA